MNQISDLRSRVRKYLKNEQRQLIEIMCEEAGFSPELKKAVLRSAQDLCSRLGWEKNQGFLHCFLCEYNIASEEGAALISLLETIKRIPDDLTIYEMIEDKIARPSWHSHIGHSPSPLVNASTWGLVLSEKIISKGGMRGPAKFFQNRLKNFSKPLLRYALEQTADSLRRQLIFADTIRDAMNKSSQHISEGYVFSYCMTGENALTAEDARHCFESYEQALRELGEASSDADITLNTNFSIKLSKLHPRFEELKRERVMAELTERCVALARLAKAGNLGLMIEAEEAHVVELTMDIVEILMLDPDLDGWNGLGLEVQAYGRWSPAILDWLQRLAIRSSRKMMVRLSNGACLDREIKSAQVLGAIDFPVFTKKSAIEISYLCNAKKLIDYSEHLYPQFATHNPYTIAAVLEIAGRKRSFEFLSLHGFADSIRAQIKSADHMRWRLWAPVGQHEDCLGSMFRQLLENGTFTKAVHHRCMTKTKDHKQISDPFEQFSQSSEYASGAITLPGRLYAPERVNSYGLNWKNREHLCSIEIGRALFSRKKWTCKPMTAGSIRPAGRVRIYNPAKPGEEVGDVYFASAMDVEQAVRSAKTWDAASKSRSQILIKTSDLIEANYPEFAAILARETGKALKDAIFEIRSAVDHIRYYASQADKHSNPQLGIVASISPMNYPLSIFTGQIAAALAMGNAVIAKPAELSSLTAGLATELFYEAGVPRHVLQLLPGRGEIVGDALCSNPALNGVIFTGNMDTALSVNRAMASALPAHAPLLSATGAINAMIVDSTADLEQAVRDAASAAFMFAGQCCSGLKVLFAQKDIYDQLLAKLSGAIDELEVGDPWNFSADVGPVISKESQKVLRRYIGNARDEGRLIKQASAPEDGWFVGPALIKIDHIQDIPCEIPGPVLHIASYNADQLDDVISQINRTQSGLTFGAHSRIDKKISHFAKHLNVGNIFVNRPQTGSMAGSQPFGGEGCSGTGPKAGGPLYLERLSKPKRYLHHTKIDFVRFCDEWYIQRALTEGKASDTKVLEEHTMPGPVEEINHYRILGRGTVLCLGPEARHAREQAAIARRNGCFPVIVAPGADRPGEFDGTLTHEALCHLDDLDIVAFWGGEDRAKTMRVHLAAREGRIIPLATGSDLESYCRLERHTCINTSIAGGSVDLSVNEAHH